MERVSRASFNAGWITQTTDAVVAPTLNLDFGGAETFVTTAYELIDATPYIADPLGVLLGGSEQVTRRGADGPDGAGVWTLRFRFGPMARPVSALLRRSVGRTLTFLVDDPDRPAADWPHTEAWTNNPLPGYLAAVKVDELMPDLAAGARYGVEVQLGARPAGGPARPRPPAPQYDPPGSYWGQISPAFEAPTSAGSPLGEPVIALQPHVRRQGAPATGTIGEPVFSVAVVFS